MSQKVFRFPILIPGESANLAACIYRSVDNLTAPQPGIAVSGSWMTVKEQMADCYANELALRGYTVLTFDFAGWGESEGTPRQTEIPARKNNDIVAATRFLRSLSCVRSDGVGYLAICASAMYAAAAIEFGAPIAALCSVAGWFHDAQSVADFYGGTEGVRVRLARATEAFQKYSSNRELNMVQAYEAGNDRAGMFFPIDYYANSQRGRIGAWRNEMTELTWAYWLTFDGLRAAEKLAIPTLFVHGDECALPENIKRIHARMPGCKELIWTPGSQVDFYDRPDLVTLSVNAADRHFQKYLDS